MPGGLTLKTHHPAWKQRTPRDLGAGWDFEDVRDFYLQTLFGVDSLALRYADHDRYLQLSRVVTGEVMSNTFREWRRGRSQCNGALVWFLKDLWAGAGWGIIDAAGAPKAAYYYLKRALQPLAVGISDEGGNGLALHVVNEHPKAVAAKLTLAAYRDGEVLVGSASREISVPPRQFLEIPALELFEHFTDLSYAYRFGPPAQNLLVAQLVDGSEVLAEACHFPTGLSLPTERELGITARAQALPNGDATVTIGSTRFAQAVTIAVNGYQPEDQYFHVAPGGKHAVNLRRMHDKATLAGTVSALNCSATTRIELAA
jgi:beta-mannosidase